MATLNHTLGDRLDSLRTDTGGRLDTLDPRLVKMEEHGLTTNQTLSMLERNINQNNQEIVLIRRNLVDVDKSLISVHKKVKDLDSHSTDISSRMQNEFATIYTRLAEVQNNLKEDSDMKITSLQSDIDALTGSINARIAKEMDTVLTKMEE
jgi:chromosome segregation ATPase